MFGALDAGKLGVANPGLSVSTINTAGPTKAFSLYGSRHRGLS